MLMIILIAINIALFSLHFTSQGFDDWFLTNLFSKTCNYYVDNK